MSKLWEHYGAKDPYYGVLSAPEYHADRMDAEAMRRFFDSGVRDIEQAIAAAEHEFGPVRFDTALDYGCGAGRLSRCLAERFKQVISVDISESMLDVARANIGGGNVTYENAARMSTAQADFMISLMVFQHIPPSRGLTILTDLAKRLRGTGIIELPVRDKASLMWRGLRLAKRITRAALPVGPPVIPMYVYEEAAVLRTLEQQGCKALVSTYVDTEMFIQARVMFHR